MPETWFKILADADEPMVSIYGEIGAYGISAKDFTEKFCALIAPKIGVRINSLGGDFFQSCAIYNAIKEHPSEITCYIDGLAASGGSIVAIAGDKVRIAKNGFLMVHNAQADIFGTAEELRKHAEVLDKLNATMVKLYAAKTGKTPEAIAKMLDAETWMDADEAKAMGFVDSIDDEDEDEDEDSNLRMTAAVRAVAKYQKAPEPLRKYAATLALPAKTAKQTPTEKPMASKIVMKDGKAFVSIDGKEHEVEVPQQQTPAPATAVVKTEPDAAALAAAVATARAEGQKAERDYRAMFSTVVATAKLDAATTAEFEKEFYGRDEKDLKFLASHAIGKRTVAVGESGGKEGEAGANGGQADPAAAVELEAGKRFDDEPEVRSMYGVNLRDPASKDYKSARGRHVAAARRRYLSEKK